MGFCPFPRSEFKELRKQWRQAKKEQEEQDRQAQAEREAQMQMQAQGIPPLGVGMGGPMGISGMPAMPSMMPMRSPLTQPVHHPQHAAAYGYPPARELEHHRANVHRRMSIAEPYPDPHSHHAMNAHTYMPAHTHAHGYGSPSGYSLNAPAHALDAAGARYPPPSPAEEPSHALRYPHEGEDNIQVLAQQYRQPGYGAQPPAHWPQPGQGHGQHELRHHASHPQMGMSASVQRPVHPYYTVHPNASPTLPPNATQSHAALPPLAAQSSSNYPPGIAGASGSSTDLPALAAHTSLGRNQLPPDSTLLTPLPGYEPDPEVAHLMDTQPYTQGDDQDDGYSRDGNRYYE